MEAIVIALDHIPMANIMVYQTKKQFTVYIYKLLICDNLILYSVTKIFYHVYQKCVDYYRGPGVSYVTAAKLSCQVKKYFCLAIVHV